MAKTLIGYKEFKSKKGELCRVATVSEPYTEFAKKNGAVGVRVEDIFVPSGVKFSATEADMGREVDISYDVMGNRAYVTDITYL